MSYNLSLNKNYVRAITSGRSLPSAKGLLILNKALAVDFDAAS